MKAKNCATAGKWSAPAVEPCRLAFRVFLACLPLFLAVTEGSGAEPIVVSISLATNEARTRIGPDFCGLSFESSLLRPSDNGFRYFRPDNKPLLNLFHTVGIKSLRVGGNSSDRNFTGAPSEADLDSLFEFSRAVGVKVIYCLRLYKGNAETDAAMAKYIMTRYAAQMDCFSLGQEPSAYPKVRKTNGKAPVEGMGVEFEKYPYALFAADWKEFATAVLAAAPEARFCGPSVHNNGAWARDFIADFGQGWHVALITEHLYPGGSGDKVKSAETGRARMLSGEFDRGYQRLYDSFVPQAAARGLPYRLEEVNNYFNGGATNVSNTFAAALWGLDFMYWWATHGAAGLNFHTGDRVAAGATLRPSRYTAFYSTPAGFAVRPLAYGIKAFDLGSHGQVVPLTVSNPAQANLRAYAVLGGDGRLYLTLLNIEEGPAVVKLSFPKTTGLSRGEVLYLEAPDGNFAATEGVTLGGSEIKSDGTWTGEWSALDISQRQLRLRPACAAVIRLTKGEVRK